MPPRPPSLRPLPLLPPQPQPQPQPPTSSSSTLSTPRVAPHRRAPLLLHQSQSRKKSESARSAKNSNNNNNKYHRHPIDDYYALLLSQPLPVNAATHAPAAAPPQQPSSPPPTSTSPPSTSTPPLVTTPTSASASASDPATDPSHRARIVFGSRLAGPGAREAAEMARKEQKARGEGNWVGGTWVPPRPREPDNCCMSGCVNCVWDAYGEELEGWARVRASALEEVQRRERERVGRGREVNGDGGSSMDDDGGGSEALWGSGGGGEGLDGGVGEEALFEGVPVGIREFMKSEKRLRERKERRERTEAEGW